MAHRGNAEVELFGRFGHAACLQKAIKRVQEVEIDIRP